MENAATRLILEGSPILEANLSPELQDRLSHIRAAINAVSTIDDDDIAVAYADLLQRLEHAISEFPDPARVALKDPTESASVNTYR